MGLLDKLLGKKPGYNDFAREMIRTLKSFGAHEIREDVATRSVRIDSADATYYLDNAFSDYVSVTAPERPEVLRRYAASFTQKRGIPSDYAACKSQLLPVVRDPAYYGLTYLMFKAKGADISKLNFVTREFAPGLAVGIAHDTPNNIATIGASQLATWQVTPEQAFDQALSNLREKSSEPRFKELGSGLYVAEWGDCYDTARILLPEMFHRLPLDGAPVVFLPNRDTLFVTGSYNVSAQSVILKHGSAIHFEQGHSLSPNFYVHSDGNWSLFTPGDQSVAREARAVRYRREVMDYEQQKQYLEDLHKRESQDIFIASCQLLQLKDESLFTRCVWTNGVDSLLPVVDNLVLLIDIKAKELLSLPWDKAWPVLSPFLEKVPDLVPVRYRARTFPPVEQLRTLPQFAC